MIAQLLTADELGLREHQVGLRLGQLLFRLVQRGGLGTPFQFKQPLAGGDLLAALDRTSLDMRDAWF